jgi:hypothetical protein
VRNVDTLTAAALRRVQRGNILLLTGADAALDPRGWLGRGIRSINPAA